MNYNKKPKMVLFDVGGTLFDDGRCIPADGFEKLRLAALNPEVTNGAELAALWDEYLAEVSGLKSKSGTALDIPLSAVIRYATMNTGLRFGIPIAHQEEIFDRFNSARTVIGGVPELLAELDAKIRAMKDALPEAAEEFELDEDDDEDDFDIRTVEDDL